MPSQKSNATSATARAPKRSRGRRRVEDLLNAAVTTFADKGFDAATMTEIAATASAPIGSLYQFFPTKTALAQALLARYDAHLSARLDAICDSATEVTLGEFTSLLLNVLMSLEVERRCAMTLLEAHTVPPDCRKTLRRSLRTGTARALRARAPELSDDEIEVAAVVVVNAMKAMVHMGEEADPVRARANWHAMVEGWLGAQCH
ncbi:TetR/AcrR family transcriptional regulator [Larsenimonas rhizosphaerae]|uniref:Helix-turn-helix domain containing protein n=1 Tax=Larsenimonas rhizosphaerae TaxID=2944682 RepID=A0AA41ZIC3_9GAMM|nr:TetR/AcrR family transcriptional regulator [Larsenimonas rhizosphaerae]MCX2525241.1 helix-turn-helix domain containing protein [Larsenimonas rhizosphaerae]